MLCGKKMANYNGKSADFKKIPQVYENTHICPILAHENDAFAPVQNRWRKPIASLISNMPATRPPPK